MAVAIAMLYVCHGGDSTDHNLHSRSQQRRAHAIAYGRDPPRACGPVELARKPSNGHEIRSLSSTPPTVNMLFAELVGTGAAGGT